MVGTLPFFGIDFGFLNYGVIFLIFSKKIVFLSDGVIRRGFKNSKK